MKVNQIIVNGSFEQKRKTGPERTSIVRRAEIKKRFFGNSFTLRSNTLRLFITNCINELIIQGKLGFLIKKRIENELQCKIGKVILNITNIHHNFNLPISIDLIKSDILPTLTKLFGIKIVKVREEAQSPHVPIPVKNFLESKLHNTFTIDIEGATLKIQYNQAKSVSCFSLITTSYSTSVQKFILYLKEIETKYGKS